MTKTLLIPLVFAASGVGETVLCGAWDTYECPVRPGYSFETCVWGPAGAWTQCIEPGCDTNNSWMLSYSFGGTGDGVQAYPNICYQAPGNGRTSPAGFPFKVSDLRPTYAKWVVDMMPTDGRWNCSFDIWTAPNPYDGDRNRQLELMILINYNDVANNTAPRATIEGHTWAVYRQYFGWKYLAFLAEPKFNAFARMNLTEFVKYAMEHGDANANDYVSLVQAGFEISKGIGNAHVKEYRLWQETSSIQQAYSGLPASSSDHSKPGIYMIVDKSSPASYSQTGLFSRDLCRIYDLKGKSQIRNPAESLPDGAFIYGNH